MTENLAEVEALDKEPPVIRDPIASAYYRQEQRGILIGPYEMENAQAWGLDGIDWSFDMELLPPDLEQIQTSLEHAMHRLPCFETAGIKRIVNGPITHLPDGSFLLGPAPGVKNYWMCCGASIGITQGPGAGKYLAQWMVHGQPDINIYGLDPRRYGDCRLATTHWKSRSTSTSRCTRCTIPASSAMPAARCGPRRSTRSSRTRARIMPRSSAGSVPSGLPPMA